MKIFLAAALTLLPVVNICAQGNGQPSQLPPVTVNGFALAAIPQSESAAVTIVSGQDVGPGEINSTRDLTAQAPGFTVFDANDQRSPRFSVRGFRENNFGAGEPVVGFYVDDVPYFDMLSRGVQLYDVRDIEFLSGDQGTLYGASGVGGVVNITTRQPANATHGYIEASYGNYNSQDYQLGLGGALVQDKLFFGIDGLYAFRDGFVDNNFLHDRPDAQNTADGRATIRWTPSAPWSITLTANGGRDNDGFVPTYLPGADAGPFNVDRNVNGFVDTYNTGEALRIGYASDSVKFTSVTSHREWRQDLFQDFDFSTANAVDGFSNPRLEQWSQEVRFESPPGADKLQWRAGFFYLNDVGHGDSGSIVFLPPPAATLLTQSDSRDDTLALFGQATYNVWEHFDLIAGVRLTEDYREIYRVGTASGSGSGEFGFGTPPAVVTGEYGDSATYTAVQPKLGLAWHIKPTLEVYATATQGYQSGGFNPSVDTASQSQYGPERSWQFELGAKSSWLHEKLSVNAALFYTDANNYQTYLTNPEDPTQAYLLNAHRAELYGAELEVTARPVPALDISAGVAYTQARYNSFTVPAADTGGAPADLDGKPVSFVPEFTGDLSVRFRLPWWHLYVRGEGIAVGPYHLDDAEDITSGPTVQDAYILVNAQAGYENSHFNVYLFAKNILDSNYYNNALNLGTGYGGSLVLQPGDPLTFGIAAGARF